MDEKTGESNPFSAVLEFIREGYPDEIDKAYEFFYEEEYPEDFLSGTALDLAFVNFEDWLLCDYRGAEGGASFIDLYIEKQGADLPALDREALKAIRDSIIGLYEVVSSVDGRLKLKDLIFAEEIELSGGFEGMEPGDIFAARLYRVLGAYYMGRSIYPFGRKRKEYVLSSVDNQFERYKKNKNPEGTLRDFLKSEAYLFNMIWMSAIAP